MKHYYSKFRDLYFINVNNSYDSLLKRYYKSPVESYSTPMDIESYFRNVKEDIYFNPLIDKIIFPIFIIKNLIESFDSVLFSVFKTVLNEPSMGAYPAKVFYHLLHSVFTIIMLLLDCISLISSAILAVPLALKSGLDGMCGSNPMP